MSDEYSTFVIYLLIDTYTNNIKMNLKTQQDSCSDQETFKTI